MRTSPRTGIRVLGALALADFRERVRRPAYAVVLLAAVGLGYLAAPAAGAHWTIVNAGAHRGIYNSAYIGTVTALAGALWLSAGGFYVIRTAIARDRQSGVGELLAATPMRTGGYLLGKFLSNLLVLGSMAAALAATALAMQLARGESRAVYPIALLSPFVLCTLPVLAVTAAAAVLFETTPVLRAGLGNVIWLFVAMVGAIAGQSANAPLGGLGVPAFAESLRDEFANRGITLTDLALGLMYMDDPPQPVPWHGIDFTAAFAGQRLLLTLLAAAAALVPALWFDRFDRARASSPTKRSPHAAPAPHVAPPYAGAPPDGGAALPPSYGGAVPPPSYGGGAPTALYAAAKPPAPHNGAVPAHHSGPAAPEPYAGGARPAPRAGAGGVPEAHVDGSWSRSHTGARPAARPVGGAVPGSHADMAVPEPLAGGTSSAPRGPATVPATHIGGGAWPAPHAGAGLPAPLVGGFWPIPHTDAAAPAQHAGGAWPPPHSGVAVPDASVAPNAPDTYAVPSAPGGSALGGSAAGGSAPGTGAKSLEFTHSARLLESTPVVTPRGAGALRVIRGEFRILTGGVSRWWWLGTAALILIGLATIPAGADAARPLLVAAWIWPVLVWSRLGAQAREHGVEGLFAAYPSPVFRTLAQWLASVAMTAVIASGPGLAMAADGHLTDWLAGAAFVSALALALGVISRTQRFFQAVYPLLWYMVINDVAGLDYMGVLPGGPPPLAVGTAALLLLLAALTTVALRHRHR